MTEMKREKSCGAVIVRNDAEGKFQVLVIRQVQGHWCFPKGHVEGQETEEETAKREVLEETGLQISLIPGFRDTTEYSPVQGVQKEVVYFLAEALDGSETAQLEEVAEIYWASIIEAESLITYDNDANILRKAIHALRAMDPDGETWHIKSA